jgi:hypothetical protein
MAEIREGLCELCGQEYRCWAAASPLWNAVVRGGSIDGEEEYAFLCADCFMGLAEDRNIATAFQLRAAQSIPLEMTTPSGRVWNDEAFRFDEKEVVQSATLLRSEIRSLWQRRHSLTPDEWQQSAPILLGLAVAQLSMKEELGHS